LNSHQRPDLFSYLLLTCPGQSRSTGEGLESISGEIDGPGEQVKVSSIGRQGFYFCLGICDLIKIFMAY